MLNRFSSENQDKLAFCDNISYRPTFYRFRAPFSHGDIYHFQMKAAAVDAGERGYGLIKSLATPENMEWAETTALKYMELCKEYWSWALEHMVQAAAAGQASAVAFYGSAQEFVINNFIK